ncbi:MAG: hypothetical protein EHM42_09965 [Planctomycetaceae bacterium]|nr:MAG: hypothetical protein EHM42_09965 [Planctomycetaceae bacterium]
MLTVSSQAAARMELLLQDKAPADNVVLRITRGKNRLCLRLSHIRPGDQTFANGERPVLALDKRVGSALARRHLGVRQTDSGPRLTFKSQ